ncbi:tight junction protein ZO-3 [Bifidobacterium saguini DSM 23967]|uniref:Tight junction protein ZO-3 n=2 Tax=Bifidobacterium saguini TaxID=762210 RepID=A0A087D6L4_9BIFI|nr:hypothetical protein [Bifidobacterium saguini]KFI91164.1 tight junction protein ZO-3 [Bifidobacterium saguini DSM 23967]QTB91131.1 tight junction protein ZO-3 [Bifidobacterium saguini]
MNKLLNHIFKDWTLEEFTGLLFTLIALIATTGLIATIGLIGYTIATGNDQPKQTTIQKIETTGDIKRFCIEIKTGDHIDAIDCELIDPMTGGVAK